jgi:hypothetical protein
MTSSQSEELGRFIKRVAHGGHIVSSAALTPEQITRARASGRMLVTDDGLGFVYVPREAPSVVIGTHWTSEAESTNSTGCTVHHRGVRIGAEHSTPDEGIVYGAAS